MRESIRKEFGNQRPRAIVLDDSARARLMTARRLRSRGFDVVQCASPEEFVQVWKPGTADVVIADWELSHDKSLYGDRILEEVRKRDWDVPFVLVSGKLDQGGERAQVLENLLESGSARFVRRGAEGIRQACEEAEDLIERRDLALLKVILSLRPAALQGEVIQTSSGPKPVEELLESVVAKPQLSHDAGRPVAIRRSQQSRPRR